MAQQQPAKDISTDSAGSPGPTTKSTTTQGPTNSLSVQGTDPATPVARKKRPFNPPYIGGYSAGEVTIYKDGEATTRRLDPLFAFPLDTSNGVYDAVAYLADDENRARYTTDELQLVIGRVMRAAQDFGIEVEGISNVYKN